jgi:uncharacterized membrane protein
MLNHLLLVGALGSGLMAGFFFAFSVCVMRALGRIAPAQGIAAMQSINVVVINPWFLVVFFGTAAAGVIAMVAVSVRWPFPGTLYVPAGGVAYLIGTIDELKRAYGG